jgi:mannose-6-phosphate isomerase-like protein (cupin superfamily)
MYLINRSASPENTFKGGEHGPSTISVILVDNGPGEGPRLHRHPYDETWIIEAGRVQIWIGDETGEAGAGDFVVSPPNTPHKFKCLGPGRAKLVCVHASPTMSTEWLE